MPGILESIFAGAATGGGAAMEDVYRRRDDNEMRSKLEEQKAKADQDRQVALERMRQSGAQALQASSQDFTRGENATTRDFQSGEKALDRTQQSTEKALDRDITLKHYGIVEGQNAASNSRYDRQSTEIERHNRAMEGIYSGRDGAKAGNAYDRIPEQAKIELGDLTKEYSGLQSELRKARADAMKPENKMDPNMAASSAQYVKELEKSLNDVNMKRVQTQIRHGLIDPSEIVSRAAPKFDSLDNINQFIQGQQQIGGQDWAKKVADALDRAGIPQRFANAKPKDAPADSPAVQKGGPSNNAPTGARPSAPASIAPANGPPAYAGQYDQGMAGILERPTPTDQPPAPPSISEQRVKSLTTNEIMKMDMPELRALFGEPAKYMSKEQAKAAAARYQQVR